jgi:hypothetical protein
MAVAIWRASSSVSLPYSNVDRNPSTKSPSRRLGLEHGQGVIGQRSSKPPFARVQRCAATEARYFAIGRPGRRLSSHELVSFVTVRTAEEYRLRHGDL